jgi:type IV pilus assembly protein PilQ
MQGDGLGEQMANPRVMTTDRVKASITQGVQIPYTTQTANIINTNFKDAVLQLDVTPQITPGGSVIMELDITRDSQGKNVVTGGQENVAIDKRGIKTKVQVEDGETVVLGGVYESNYMDNKNSVPWFGDLPVLGWLFRDNFKRDDKTELLVFVTPKIVKSVVSASNGS